MCHFQGLRGGCLPPRARKSPLPSEDGHTALMHRAKHSDSHFEGCARPWTQQLLTASPSQNEDCRAKNASPSRSRTTAARLIPLVTRGLVVAGVLLLAFFAFAEQRFPPPDF